MDFINHSRLHSGSNAKIFSFAKGLRKDGTNAEEVLWKHIRVKRILGYKFRRQHPIKNYIADFYCHEANLVIEIDGEIHKFTNEEVFENLESVITRIHFELENFLVNKSSI